MTRGSGPEGTQRSVAELLAAYGGGRTDGGGGRRRRRDDDPVDAENEAAPQRIIERVRHGAPPVDGAAHRHGGHRGTGAAEFSNGVPATAGLDTARHAEAPTEQLPVLRHPRRERPGPEQSRFEQSRFEQSRFEQTGFAEDTAALPPPLPRQEVPGAPAAGEPPAGLDTAGWDEHGQTEEVALPADADVQPSTGVAVPPDEHPGDPYADDGFHPDQHYSDDDHVEAEQERSTAKDWLVMASQLAAGVIGGAALWLTFQWLWRSIPVLALVVALVVITGLVWVVRVLRRAEDLQTTVIAVLVGLFVTVSPAALLLVAQ